MFRICNVCFVKTTGHSLLIALAANCAQNPYEFIGFRDKDDQNPYKFIGFRDTDAQHPYEIIRFLTQLGASAL